MVKTPHTVCIRYPSGHAVQLKRTQAVQPYGTEVSNCIYISFYRNGDIFQEIDSDTMVDETKRCIHAEKRRKRVELIKL